MSTARLVYYNHTGSVSGAEVVLLSVLPGLDRARFSPVLLCPEGALRESCESLGVPHVAVPEVKARFTGNPFKLMGYLGSAAASIVAIRRRLREQRPDLVHANSVRAGLVASFAALGSGVPVLWHIHDILPQHGLTTIIRRLARTLPHTHLVAVSKATAESFRGEGEGVVRRPIEVIYNSVDHERFAPDAVARARMRGELGLRDDQIAIGVIGQLTARKGLLELVAAFVAQHEAMPDAVLVLVGAAMFHEANRAYAVALEQRIAALGASGYIWMAGSRKDIPAVMNAMDVLAQNSLVEPLGMSLMEGFACCKTAASTGVDGVLEVVEDGRTGLLSAPGNAAELVENIRLLVSDAARRERLGIAARQRMIDCFSPALQTAKMCALYDRILRSKPAARRRTEAGTA